MVTWDKGKLTQEYEARYVNGYESPFGTMLESHSGPPSTLLLGPPLVRQLFLGGARIKSITVSRVSGLG